MTTVMRASDIGFTDSLVASFIQAVHNNEPVAGFTHTFYRYPARFSPLFARASINTFTRPGDVVLDPFMGGGTALVEARILGRRAIGTDISQLATFVSRVKTTTISERDLSAVSDWADRLSESLNAHNKSVRDEEWIERGYQRNINGKNTWPIRKILELGIARVRELPLIQQQNFARCVLLRSGQWALDCRKEIPTAAEFREQLYIHLAEMIEGAREFSATVRSSDDLYKSIGALRTLCLNRSVIGMRVSDRLCKWE
jgi:hypothetical protein